MAFSGGGVESPPKSSEGLYTLVANETVESEWNG